MASNPVPKLTAEQYLAIERAAERKSEFVDGEMFAMSGGTNRHARIQRNLITELDLALEGGDREPFGSDSRVKVSNRAFVYPDATVVCGGHQAIDGSEVPALPQYRFAERIHISKSGTGPHRAVPPPTGWHLDPARLPGSNEELKMNSMGVAIPLRRIYRQVSIAQAADSMLRVGAT